MLRKVLSILGSLAEMSVLEAITDVAANGAVEKSALQAGFT